MAKASKKKTEVVETKKRLGYADIVQGVRDKLLDVNDLLSIIKKSFEEIERFKNGPSNPAITTDVPVDKVLVDKKSFVKMAMCLVRGIDRPYLLVPGKRALMQMLGAKDYQAENALWDELKAYFEAQK